MDASAADEEVLRMRVQNLLDCTPQQAQGIMMQIGRDGRPVSPTAPPETRWKENFELRRLLHAYRRSRAQSPPPHPTLPLRASEGEQGAESAEIAFLPRCPSCGSEQLEHRAIQIRSQDEGPTNFFKCKNTECKCYNTLVKPVYKN